MKFTSYFLNMADMKMLEDPDGNPVYYQGLGPEAGELPAFVYFALSGEESLTLEPYNSPAALLEGAPIRVFSFTIPGHGPSFDKLHAMQYWADQLESHILEIFFEKTVKSLGWLIESNLIDPNHLAVGGLSRGGFVAAHVAALEPRIKTILGFAPLTRLGDLQEFASMEEATHAKMHASALDLEHLTDRLTHLRQLRFYIGNRDERVSTDACYRLIRRLADKAHEIRARHMQIELMITPSIGHKGHGTAPHIFAEGVSWLKEQL